MADILLMQPNAEVVFITTGGAEVRADWSEAANENFSTHMENQLEVGGHSLLIYEVAEEAAEEIEQLLLLQELVTQSIGLVMPHKSQAGQTNQDLSLGTTISSLREMYDADYVLFTDHYSQIESGGVFLMQVAFAAGTGVAPPSQNLRFTRATVFDMETGDVVDTDIHMFGDPRDVGESSTIVSNLLKDIEFGVAD